MAPEGNDISVCMPVATIIQLGSYTHLVSGGQGTQH